MAKTESKMIPLGSKAPYFKLPDSVSGKSLSLEELSKDSQAVVVAFICNHCPFVKHLLDALCDFSNSYKEKGLSFIAISSNDATAYPEDAPSKMATLAREKNFSFPYLYDESQEVAKAFQAACTPDFFLFDKDLRLAYRGQFDDSRPGNNIEPTGESLAQALKTLLRGESPDAQSQKASLGCNIKWKS